MPPVRIAPFSGLSSMVRPLRTARLPNTIISVSGPEWPAKLDPGCVPPLMAVIHSLYTPSVRGYFCAGLDAIHSACFFSSQRIGSPPYVPATIVPLSPVQSWPPSTSGGQARAFPYSSGRAGYSPPSRQTSVMAGREPCAGNSYVMRDAFGADSANRVDDSGITRDGYLRPNVQKEASMMWHAMSPMAPVPKSHH